VILGDASYSYDAEERTTKLEKQVDVVDVRRRFDQVLGEVALNGDRYIVSDRGEPVVAIVPMAIYEQWNTGRSVLFAQMHAMAERANLTEEEGEQLIAEAIAAVRSGAMR